VQRAYGEGTSAAPDKCPDLKELGKKFRTPDFTEDLYAGTWYELAYHDVTQANYFCGCTRFNFTKRSTLIEDMFTTTCPMTGVLPGEVMKQCSPSPRYFDYHMIQLVHGLAQPECLSSVLI